jgi:hypothetical protein
MGSVKLIRITIFDEETESAADRSASPIIWNNDFNTAINWSDDLYTGMG